MANGAEVAAGITVELVVAALAAGVLYRLYGAIFSVPKRHVVAVFQRGVVLRDGQVEKVLAAGRYWITPRRNLVLCDMRLKPFQVAGQDLLTLDGRAIRISLGGEYRVADPARFVTESSDPFSALFLDLRHALRAAVSEMNAEMVLRAQSPVTARVRELLVPRAAQLGVELIQLEVWEAVPLGRLVEN